MFRGLLRKVLESQGYQVLVAENPAADLALAAAHGDDLRGDNRRLTATVRCIRLEPVPAPVRIRTIDLAWNQHERPVAVGMLGDARQAGNVLGRLATPVAQHDQRRATQPAMAARNVHEVIARWRDERCGRQEAAQR